MAPSADVLQGNVGAGYHGVAPPTGSQAHAGLGGLTEKSIHDGLDSMHGTYVTILPLTLNISFYTMEFYFSLISCVIWSILRGKCTFTDRVGEIALSS